MSVLTIPAATVSFVLPTPFSFVSHQANFGDQEIADSTYVTEVCALKPEGWRIMVNAAQTCGWPASPSTLAANMMGPGGTNWMDVHTSNQSPTPYFHVVLNCGPALRPGGSGSPRGDNASNYPTGATQEGSTAVLRAWGDNFVSRFGAKAFQLGMVNEPGLNVCQLANWYCGTGFDDYNVEAWTPVQVRHYKTALGGVMRFGYPVWADSSFVNGTDIFQMLVIGGTSVFGSNWPYSDDNIAANAYDVLEWHAYSSDNNHSFERDMNAAYNPSMGTVNPGSGNSASGMLAGFDYIRSLLNGAGAASKEMFCSEWEPVLTWGRAGQGAVSDAGMAIIAINRQANWKLRGFTFMDVIRDTGSFQSPPQLGDQIMGYQAGTWTRLPRYWWLKNAIIPQMSYKNVVSVPMYTGDAASATWNTPPGLTNAASPTVAVQRHQVSFAWNADYTSFRILIVDIQVPGASAEQITINLPVTLSASASEICYMDPYYGYVGLNPNNAYTPPDASPTITTPALSGSSLTTGAGSIPTLNPGSSIYIKVAVAAGTTPVNNNPPVVSGSTVKGGSLSCASTLADWTNANSLSFQWNRDGSPIGGATAMTYTSVTADVTHMISCTVTGTNVTGSTPATSNSVGPITNPPAGGGGLIGGSVGFWGWRRWWFRFINRFWEAQWA